MIITRSPGTGTIDRDALAALRSAPLDWHFPALPTSWHGLALDDAAARRANLFEDEFVGPFVVLDRAALDHNLTTMARWCADRGIALAPHGKTTMAPQLFAEQLDHGAWGITAATGQQLRIYRQFGVSRILLANELVDPAALRWLASELDGDPEFEFGCWVDSVAGVELMDAALRSAGARRPVDVLVELGGDGGRTGVRDRATAFAVAEAAARTGTLRLIGVAGYEGALAHGASADSLSTVSSYVDGMRELTVALAEAGLFDTGEIVVTAGGSAFFDRVADGLTEGWPDGLAVLPVLRSGAYLTHDDGIYRADSPLGATPRIQDVPPLRPALRGWAQVISQPAADLALLTAGKRDFSFDEGLPEPQVHRRDRETRSLAGHRVTKLNDQHTYLALPAGSPVRVGDWIGLGLSHPCTVFDKWPLIPVVDTDGETVIDLVRTFF